MNGGGGKRGGGRGDGGAQGGGRGRGGGRPGGAGRGPGRGRGPGTGRGPGGGGGRGADQPQPLEIAVRSTRNAIKRHAESLRDDQARLACRSTLVALQGNMSGTDNPAELLGVLEQVQHVLHATRRDDSQLPVALRAVIAFATETPARQRAVQELARLVLRHLYALNADFIPRQARDDGRFRSDAVLDVVGQLAREYLDDARFEQLRS